MEKKLHFDNSKPHQRITIYEDLGEDVSRKIGFIDYVLYMKPSEFDVTENQANGIATNICESANNYALLKEQNAELRKDIAGMMAENGRLKLQLEKVGAHLSIIKIHAAMNVSDNKLMTLLDDVHSKATKDI